MPQSLSLLLHPDKFKVAKDWLGTKVPWETKTYLEDMQMLDSVGGVFDLSSWVILEIEGTDAVDYLQRMTTVNFKTLPLKIATYGAFLTGKGTVVSLGLFIKEENKVLYITTEFQHQTALEHIEKFHFAENFKTTDLSESFALFGWWNLRKELREELHLEETLLPGQVEWRRWKSMDLEIFKDPARPELYFFKFDRKYTEKFLFELERIAVSIAGHRAFENVRIRSGVPELGADLTEKEIILESGFDIAVHRNKGCYPGQEVVERIFTYGSVNKKLSKVLLAGNALEKISLPYDLTEKGTKIGQLVSLTLDPKDPTKAWGLAYLHKGYWDRSEVFKI